MDPYSDWLGIPAGPRPPTHYQLLGLDSGAGFGKHEVEAAALDRSTAARRYQSGRYAEEATTLLNHIAAARFALLEPGRRADYDRQLVVDANLAETAAHLDLDLSEPLEPAPTVVVAMPVHAPSEPIPRPGSLIDDDDVAAVGRSFELPAALVVLLGVGGFVAWPYLTKEPPRKEFVLDDGARRFDPKLLEELATRRRQEGVDDRVPTAAKVAPPTPSDAPKSGHAEALSVPFEPGEKVLVSFKDGGRSATVLRVRADRYYVGYEGLGDDLNEWVEIPRVSQLGTRSAPAAGKSTSPTPADRSLDEQVRALDGENVAERRLAVLRLAALPVDASRRGQVADALHPLLNVKALRLDVAAALGRWGNAETARLFAEWLRERPAPPAAAILAAGQLGAEELVGPLLELLKATIQTDATISALGRVGPKAEPATLELLDHWDPMVRLAACEALAEIAGPEARAKLEKAAANPELAEAAQAALTRLSQRRKP